MNIFKGLDVFTAKARDGPIVLFCRFCTEAKNALFYQKILIVRLLSVHFFFYFADPNLTTVSQYLN